MARVVSQATRRKISQALKNRFRGAGKKAKSKASKQISRQSQQPMVLRENEGFTGYRTGTSTKRPMTQGAGKTSKGYSGGQQSTRAMQDGMGGMTGYRTKGQQIKASKQGEYTKNLRRFMGEK